MAAGEPYAQVKKRARHLLATFDQDGYKSGYQLLTSVLERCIQLAPQQTLSALCEVAEDDGV